MSKGRYEKEKAAARQKAIDLQIYLSENSVSYFELAIIQDELYRLGRRYGLMGEFHENGVL